MDLKISIKGRWDDSEFSRCRSIGAAAEACGANVETIGMFEIDWLEIHGDVTSPVIVVDNAAVTGGVDEFVQLVSRKYSNAEIPNISNKEYFDGAAKESFLAALVATGNSFTYHDIKIGEGKAKRVIYELFTSICPKTCENFEGLCSGSSSRGKYKGSYFHRVVQGGWVQGGDVVSGKGDTGKSIWGDAFPDETFSVKFERPGILAMTSKGAHTNNSQFFITTNSLPWLNTKSVAFGRVIKGFDIIKNVEIVGCSNERPIVPCKIEKAGKLDLDSVYDLKF